MKSGGYRVASLQFPPTINTPSGRKRFRRNSLDEVRNSLADFSVNFNPLKSFDLYREGANEEMLAYMERLDA